VRLIKPTYVHIGAHVEAASRIVSYLVRFSSRAVNAELQSVESVSLVVSVDRYCSTADDAALMATHGGVVQRPQQVGRRQQRPTHVVRLCHVVRRHVGRRQVHDMKSRGAV